MKNTRRPHYRIRPLPCFAVLLLLIAGSTAWAQDRNSTSPDEMTITGSVVSATRNTLVVKDGKGRHWLFVFDRDTRKPAKLTPGSEVRVESVSTDDPGVRLAADIALAGSQGSASRTEGSGVPSPGGEGAGAPAPVVPAEVRHLESQIEREARRYQAGVRAGMGLDPELVLIGVQSQIGPFFTRNLYLRPNVEFGFGEVTALFGLNLEAIYRLPVTARQSRWSTYFGLGPGFNFIHQNFERTEGGSRVDFGDFHSDTGLNILGGVRFRSGTFMELKTSVYSDTAPTLRLMVGYNF
jgi:hypothetical protein